MTLKQAIMNGLKDATSKATTQFPANVSEHEFKVAAAKVQADQLTIIEEHVLDFFRQKFGVAYLRMETEKDPVEIIQELAEATGVVRKSA